MSTCSSFATIVRIILLGLGVGLILYKRRGEDPVVTTKGRLAGHNNKNDNSNQSHHEDFELPLLDLLSLTKATDNFVANKIGEGGFGQVYKECIRRGTRSSSEAAIRNIKARTSRRRREDVGVRVLAKQEPGFSHIFDEEMSAVLDWPRRFKHYQWNCSRTDVSSSRLSSDHPQRLES
ncbi:hypothetical protein HAX54_048210 [Datura stramonium]|uniref:Protein kinase domain-containing protein n=1 Tax=Datura stramonium TaxID=4076 RepID=A0ABS8SV96_DATST|nr:hypothetical protein [Datura stramonium]